MPFDLKQDDELRRFEITGRGALDLPDLVAALERIREGDGWSYGVLLDLLLVTSLPSVSELRPIMELARSGGPNDTRGPLAIVAVNPTLYGIACAYAALAQPRGRVQVFRDRDDAKQWLASR